MIQITAQDALRNQLLTALRFSNRIFTRFTLSSIFGPPITMLFTKIAIHLPCPLQDLKLQGPKTLFEDKIANIRDLNVK